MMRTKGEAGTGNVVEAVRHARTVLGDIRRLQNTAPEELMAAAKELGADDAGVGVIFGTIGIVVESLITEVTSGITIMSPA